MLPRNSFIEGVARHLVPELKRLELSEGKMFGVLLGQRKGGGLGYLKAFSGLLHGSGDHTGWAPPIHLATPTASEAATVARLALWKTELAELQRRCDDHPVHGLRASWQARLEKIKSRHRYSKGLRDTARAVRSAADLQAESRRDSMEWRDARQAMRAELLPYEAGLEKLQAELLAGKRERSALSRGLQAEMHEQFSSSVSSLLGCSLDSLFPHGIPTGTGECCAPKLLAWAARQQVHPLALAEFWWGPEPSGQGKLAGHFYPACLERCQPLLGALLSAALRPALRVLHQDQDLLVVVKPSGLLSVPGRSAWTQDCVLSRLRANQPEVLPVHRLDLETSGLLVLARHPAAQASLQAQFEKRSVEKVYVARLSARPKKPIGRMESSIGPDPARPGCYRLDPHGKPALTEYRVLDDTLVELRPRTGRSHQLRVHLAQVLGCPIRGDRLYGHGGERLHLHANRLDLDHPGHGGRLTFESPSPF